MPASLVTAVYGPHDDVRRAFLACHLAFGGTSPGLLMDLGTPYAMLTGLLDLTPAKTWADLTAVAHELDADLLERAVTPGPGGGVLAAPDPPGGDELTPGMLHALITAARERFGRVVLDVAPQVHEPHVSALKLADRIAVVVRGDVPGVASGRKALDFLHSLGLKGRTRLVLAAGPLPNAVTPREVAGLLGGVFGVLPWDPAALTEAVNLGAPLRVRRGDLKDALADLVRRWEADAPQASVPSQGSGRLRRTGELVRAWISRVGPQNTTVPQPD